jgi:hypothetical protein
MRYWVFGTKDHAEQAAAPAPAQRV